MDRFRLEITENDICQHYSFVYYKWEKKNWWSTKKSWRMHHGHYLGYNYKLPVWAKPKTSKQLFDEELESSFKMYPNLEEIKYIKIINQNQFLLNVCSNKQ